MSLLTWIFPPITDKQTADHHIGMSGMPVFLMGVSFLLSATLFGLRNLAPLPLVLGMLALAVGFFVLGLALRASKSASLTLPAAIATGFGVLISLVFFLGLVDLLINLIFASLASVVAINGVRAAKWIEKNPNPSS